MGVTLLCGVAAVGEGSAASASPRIALSSAGAHPRVHYYGCDLRGPLTQIRSHFGGPHKHNILVWREASGGPRDFQHRVASGTFRKRLREGSDVDCYRGQVKNFFHWVVFNGSGHFRRSGDGGYSNWAFSGNWHRKGDSSLVRWDNVDKHHWKKSPKHPKHPGSTPQADPSSVQVCNNSDFAVRLDLPVAHDHGGPRRSHAAHPHVCTAFYPLGFHKHYTLHAKKSGHRIASGRNNCHYRAVVVVDGSRHSPHVSQYCLHK